jgi:hypothetical protein
MLAKQTLYLLKHTSIHFALIILELGGGLMNFLFRLDLNLNSPGSASQIARITSVSHQHLDKFFFNLNS